MSDYQALRFGDNVEIGYVVGRKLDENGYWQEADDRVRGAGGVWTNTSEVFNAEREIRSLAARVEQLERQLEEERR